MQWETVIGLEVHVQLSTRSKIFSGASTAFGAEPNTQACAVDLGLPGVLPVLNEAAVAMAVQFGLAIHAEIPEVSVFDRKNYFYPDLPKGYQTSQMYHPIVGAGEVEITLDDGSTKRVRVHHAHLEEDAGKSLHETFSNGKGHGMTGIDLNRAGTPLLEIVSEPDLRSAKEAAAYLKAIHSIVTYLGISDGNMAEGSMRCDVNVSVRPKGQEAFGTRAEIKNVNSFRFVERAIAFEVERQIELLEDGGQVVQETRHWDEDGGRTYTLRTKETTEDYRYFPDPDLVPIEPEPAWIEKIRLGLPELPAVVRGRLIEQHGLAPEQVATLADAGLVGVLEDAVAAGAPAGEAANWLANEVIGWGGEHDVDPADTALTGAHLADLVALVGEATLSKKLAREVLADVLSGKGAPRDIVAERGLEQISDEDELARLCDQVIAHNAAAAEQVRGGNQKAIGALVGGVMRATQGKANPQLVNQILRERLGVGG